MKYEIPKKYRKFIKSQKKVMKLYQECSEFYLKKIDSLYSKMYEDFDKEFTNTSLFVVLYVLLRFNMGSLRGIKAVIDMRIKKTNESKAELLDDEFFKFVEVLYKYSKNSEDMLFFLCNTSRYTIENSEFNKFIDLGDAAYDRLFNKFKYEIDNNNIFILGTVFLHFLTTLLRQVKHKEFKDHNVSESLRDKFEEYYQQSIYFDSMLGAVTIANEMSQRYRSS